MFAIRCKCCNNFPIIVDTCGCGAVFCEKCNDSKDNIDKIFFSFSKNYGKKKHAVEDWNNYNEKGVSNNGTQNGFSRNITN